MAEALQGCPGTLLVPRSCCHARGAARGRAQLPACRMTLTSTTSMAQAFFCLLLCIPWGSSCPPSCQCSERAGAKAVLCSSQHLQEIPKDIPRDVVLLKLDANSIPSNAFRHLSHLQEIDPSRNAIEHIDLQGGLQRGGSRAEEPRPHPQRSQGGTAGSQGRAAAGQQPLALRVRPAGAAGGGMAAPRLRAGHQLPHGPATRARGQAAAAGLGSGAKLCSVPRRSTDVPVLLAWFAMLTACVTGYVRHNRERSRGHCQAHRNGQRAPAPPCS